MLHWYISSVIIFTLIIWAEFKLFTNLAKENEWIDAKTANNILNKKDNIFLYFLIALIPFFRFIFVIGFIVIAIIKEKDINDV